MLGVPLGRIDGYALRRTDCPVGAHLARPDEPQNDVMNWQLETVVGPANRARFGYLTLGTTPVSYIRSGAGGRRACYVAA
jgi:hypothetical protein